MQLRRIRIQNVRALRDATWSVSKGRTTGWHVILGDNGSGKSSFLKAVALVGHDQAYGLRQSWNDWLTRGEKDGLVELQIDRNEVVDSSGGSNLEAGPVTVALSLLRGPGPNYVSLHKTDRQPDVIWRNPRGWFSASYGPFRRFGRGDLHSEKEFASMPLLSRHLSIFDDRIALTECLEWLRNLQFRRLENDPEGLLLSRLKAFINQSDFLPSGVQLDEVTSRGVVFRDAHGVKIDVEELSDGFRSILSMTFELIRQMSLSYPEDQLFDADDATVIKAEGVVLIDEIDAHLHPTWQKTIGYWFCRHFPNVQFIVSTHSPLVCQAAENGSVFLLPRAGTEGSGKMLKGQELQRLLFGNTAPKLSEPRRPQPVRKPHANFIGDWRR